jgi:hypothetical protein
MRTVTWGHWPGSFAWGLTGADSGHVREQIVRGRSSRGWFRDRTAALGEPTRITKKGTYWETKEDWV